MRKTSSRSYRVYATIPAFFLILCFPVWLWRDGNFVARREGVVIAPDRASSREVFSVPVLSSSPVSSVLRSSNASTALRWSPPVVITQTEPATSSAKVLMHLDANSFISPISQISLNISPVVSAGFGGGGEVFMTGGGSTASGRNFNDETCPLAGNSEFSPL